MTRSFLIILLLSFICFGKIRTDSLEAVSGSFTGRITGTDIDVSDSVKAVSGAFSGTIATKDINVTDLTNGYIPYKSTNLENTNIFTNGVNTAIGKNSVELWGVARRALQIGGNTAIMATVNEEGKHNSWLLNNCYFDGAWKPYASGDAASFVLGASGFEWTFDSSLTADNQFSATKIMTLSKNGVLNVKNNIISDNSIVGATGTFSGAVSGTTGTFSGAMAGDTLTITKGIKLGAGATGPTATPFSINLGMTYSNNDSAKSCKIILYKDPFLCYGIGVGQNADVQYHTDQVDGTHRFYVDDVEKFRVNNNGIDVTGSVTADSITTNGTDYFKYIEGTFPCTLKTSDVTVQQVGTINYTIVGNVVTLTFPFIYGTSNSSTLRLYCGGLTGDLDPGQNICYDVPYLTDNAVSHSGNVSYIYPAKYFSFSMKDATGFTTSGYKGIGGFLLTNKTTITYTK